jgi:hypothetical protein
VQEIATDATDGASVGDKSKANLVIDEVDEVARGELHIASVKGEKKIDGSREVDAAREVRFTDSQGNVRCSGVDNDERNGVA